MPSLLAAMHLEAARHVLTSLNPRPPPHPSPLQAINGSSRSVGLSGSLGAGSPNRSEDLGMSGLAVDGYSDLSAATVLQTPTLQGAPQMVAASGNAASLYIKGMPEDADKLWLYEKFARWVGSAGKLAELGAPRALPGLAALCPRHARWWRVAPLDVHVAKHACNWPTDRPRSGTSVLYANSRGLTT